MYTNPLLKWLATGFLVVLLLPACKKNDNPGPCNCEPNHIQDSIYFVFKDIYLWTDVVPDSATFKPNSYGNVNDMFNALISFKKDGAGNNLDRYSFMDDGSTSGALQGGKAGDMGFQPIFRTDKDLRVAFVYPGSPAGKKGIRRGWQLTAVNGNSRLGYDDATFKLLNNALAANSASFTFKKPNGSTENITLQKTTYTIDPFLFDTIYTCGARKVGYFVFNSFLAPDLIRTKAERIFNGFMEAGITDLVVDLRYNGGGTVAAAEYFANLIAPPAVGEGSTLMYTSHFNDNVVNNRFSRYLRGKKAVPYLPDMLWTEILNSEATLYNKVYFSKTGTLELNNVVFLSTRNTVSASELLYTILQPHMRTLLIGDSTYGKPVGFIDIPFANKYDMFAVTFWTKNSKGFGEYFSGLKPDVLDYEDPAIDWGQPDEIYLNDALVALGIKEARLGRKAADPAVRAAAPLRKTLPGDQRFKGMVETRYRR